MIIIKITHHVNETIKEIIKFLFFNNTPVFMELILLFLELP